MEVGKEHGGTVFKNIGGEGENLTIDEEGHHSTTSGSWSELPGKDSNA